MVLERREDRSNSGLSDQAGEQVSGSRERREDRLYSGLSDQAGEQVSGSREERG